MTEDRDQSRRNVASAWARVRKNVGVLVSGRAIFALVNLAAIAVATRAVGLEAIGAVGLLMAYARLIGDVFKFSSWQAVLTFGAPLRQAGDRGGLRRLMGLTLILDGITIAAAILVAGLGARLAGGFLGWTEEMIAVAPWFCVIILFVMQTTPVGVLRLYDRILPIASQHAVTAMGRLAGALGLWAFGGGFLALASIWVASAGLAAAILWLTAGRVAAAETGLPIFASALRNRRERLPRFWRFAGATNVASTLNTAAPPVATLVVGAVLGPAAAGVFHLVRQITEAMARPGMILSQVIYPEFSQLAALKDNRAMRRILKRAIFWGALVQAAAALILVLAGDLLLTALFGPEAATGHDVLILAGIASGVTVSGFALEPALLSTGKAGLAMRAAFGAWLVYVPALYFLVAPLGLVGVGLALIALRATQFGLRLWLALKHLRS